MSQWIIGQSVRELKGWQTAAAICSPLLCSSLISTSIPGSNHSNIQILPEGDYGRDERSTRRETSWSNFFFLEELLNYNSYMQRWNQSLREKHIIRRYNHSANWEAIEMVCCFIYFYWQNCCFQIVSINFHWVVSTTVVAPDLFSKTKQIIVRRSDV